MNQRLAEGIKRDAEEHEATEVNKRRRGGDQEDVDVNQNQSSSSGGDDNSRKRKGNQDPNASAHNHSPHGIVRIGMLFASRPTMHPWHVFGLAAHAPCCCVLGSRSPGPHLTQCMAQGLR